VLCLQLYDGYDFLIFPKIKCHSFELLAHLPKMTSHPQFFNKMTAHGVTASDFIGIDFVLQEASVV
jgi:hypothetical protein